MNIIKIIKAFFTILFLCSLCSICKADTPARVTDSKLQFAYGQVSSTVGWTQTDYNSMVSACLGGCQAGTYTPTFYEMAISTTIGNFLNFSDYNNLLTSKSAIASKVIELDTQLLVYNDMAVKYPSINTTAKRNKLTAQIDLLVGMYISLP